MREGTGNPPAPEWFIEVNGSRIGPYSADQIRGLLEEGEILPEHRVTTSALGPAWISAWEMVRQTAPAASATSPAVASPHAGLGGFRPPPRPTHLEQAASMGSDATDPAISLFDALQLHKERQSALRSIPTPTVTKPPVDWVGAYEKRSEQVRAFWQRTPLRTKQVIAGLMAVVMLLMIVRGLRKSPDTVDDSAAEAPVRVQAPSKAAAAPRSQAMPTTQLNRPTGGGATRDQEPSREETNYANSYDERVAGDVAGDNGPVDHDPVPLAPQPSDPNVQRLEVTADSPDNPALDTSPEISTHTATPFN